MEGDAAAANALDVQEGFDALSPELSRACMAPVCAPVDRPPYAGDNLQPSRPGPVPRVVSPRLPV